MLLIDNTFKSRYTKYLSWSQWGFPRKCPYRTEHEALKPMVFECWSTVYDAGPTFKQHCFSASCLLGCLAALRLAIQLAETGSSSEVAYVKRLKHHILCINDSSPVLSGSHTSGPHNIKFYIFCVENVQYVLILLLVSCIGLVSSIIWKWEGHRFINTQNTKWPVIIFRMKGFDGQA